MMLLMNRLDGDGEMRVHSSMMIDITDHSNGWAARP